jgi:hypothetical protein
MNLNRTTEDDPANLVLLHDPFPPWRAWRALRENPLPRRGILTNRNTARG